MCLKDLRDEFLYDCECRHLAKGSLRNYRAATRFLVDFLELRRITELEEVKPHHIRDLMKEKQDMGSTPRYINDLLKVWRTWFNYLVTEGYLDERDNPAKKVKPLRQPKTIIDTFTVDEMRRMIRFYDGTDFLSVRNKTIIMLLFDTGMRCNEMILMEPEDIKPDYILVKHGKGSKERVVPKSPALSKQLVKYCTLRDGYLKEHPTRYKNLFPSKNGKPIMNAPALLRDASIWPMVALIGAMTMLGRACTDASLGINSWLVSVFAPIFGGQSTIMLLLICVLFITVVTQVVNGNVLTMGMTPIIVPIVCGMMEQGIKIDPTVTLTVISTCASVAFLFPSGSVAAAYILGREEIDKKFLFTKGVAVLAVYMLVQLAVAVLFNAIV